MFLGTVRQLFINDLPLIKNVYFSRETVLGTIKTEEINNNFFSWFENNIISGKIICYGAFKNDELITYSYFYTSDYYPFCFIGGVHVDKKYINKMYNYNFTGRAEIMDIITNHALSLGYTEIYMAHTVKSFNTRAKILKKAFKNSDYSHKNKWYVIPEEIISPNKKSIHEGFNSFISLLNNNTEDIIIWKLVLREEYRQIMNIKNINESINIFKEILA